MLGMVAAGGSLGAPTRYVVGDLWTPPACAFPWSTFAINIVGAFALGLLLETLTRSGSDVGRRRSIRLLLGTGFLGTFTTYSSLVVDTDLLIHHGRIALAAVYAAGSVLVGLCAAGGGMWSAARLAGPLGHGPTEASM
ncbi:CrcB protein [Rhodococcoides kyotonense]|uniref:Fluoride-specific ion channel FluC n=2 Tax=Rhodococcoides kyotonense TaxID=398843 RepID=A0A239M3C4_9NOCA|nr:CrcB protein [Rhodococcus kyotonensis]